MSHIVIATLDENKIVISYMRFDSEARLENAMKEMNAKGLTVKTMSEEKARQFLLSGEPFKDE